MGSVTNNSTRVRIGYRIYSLWWLQLQQITITENILTLALVASITHWRNCSALTSHFVGWLPSTDWRRRLTKTNFEGRRTRINSVYCLPFLNTASNNGNTGPPTVGYHATQQYQSGERIQVFDYGCLVTTNSSQTSHHIYIYLLTVWRCFSLVIKINNTSATLPLWPFEKSSG
jgi:hypothetical protein